MNRFRQKIIPIEGDDLNDEFLQSYDDEKYPYNYEYSSVNDLILYVKYILYNVHDYNQLLAVIHRPMNLLIQYTSFEELQDIVLNNSEFIRLIDYDCVRSLDRQQIERLVRDIAMTENSELHAERLLDPLRSNIGEEQFGRLAQYVPELQRYSFVPRVTPKVVPRGAPRVSEGDVIKHVVDLILKKNVIDPYDIIVTYINQKYGYDDGDKTNKQEILVHSYLNSYPELICLSDYFESMSTKSLQTVFKRVYDKYVPNFDIIQYIIEPLSYTFSKSDLQRMVKEIPEFFNISFIKNRLELSYYELQDRLYCGIHAINNLFTFQLATVTEMNAICLEAISTIGVDTECDFGTGLYSANVLSVFFDRYGIPYNLLWKNNHDYGVIPNYLHSDNVMGFIIGTGAHWLAIRKIGNDWVWIDSRLSTDNLSNFNHYSQNNPDDLDRLYWRINQYPGVFVIFNVT